MGSYDVCLLEIAHSVTISNRYGLVVGYGNGL
jgi:hypothetical protein